MIYTTNRYDVNKRDMTKDEILSEIEVIKNKLEKAKTKKPTLLGKRHFQDWINFNTNRLTQLEAKLKSVENGRS